MSIEKTFSEKRKCPKCGGEAVEFKHCYGGAQARETLCPAGEHIHKTCSRCHYTWLERCKDAGKKGGEKHEVL